MCCLSVGDRWAFCLSQSGNVREKWLHLDYFVCYILQNAQAKELLAQWQWRQIQMIWRAVGEKKQVRFLSWENYWRGTERKKNFVQKFIDQEINSHIKNSEVKKAPQSWEAEGILEHAVC